MRDHTEARLRPASEIVGLLTPFAPAPSTAVPPDWDKVFHFCSFHGVRPALARALEAQTGLLEPPARAKEDLTQFMQRHTFSVLQSTGEIVGLSRALAAENIHGLFFKGAVLGEQIYGGASHREFNDIDLLVDPGERDKVADLLEQMGYVPAIADRQFRRAFCDYAGQHIFRHRITGSVVDLHWNFAGGQHFTIGSSEALRNSVTLQFGGVQIPVPQRDDLALILAGHGQKEGWMSFGWALDFAQFAAAFPDFDWSRAEARAASRGASRALLTAVRLVERLFGNVIDPQLAVRARRQRRVMDDVERIVDGYHALAVRRYEDDLKGALRLCETTSQRAGVWWRLATTRTVGDYEARPLAPRLWWLYYFTRPFRLGRKIAAKVF
jgi:hypothetical protein